MSPHYRQSGFFTGTTMKGVRDAISGARGFMADATLHLWSSICLGDRDGFVSCCTFLFKEDLANKKK